MTSGEDRPEASANRWRRLSVHAARVLIFALIILLIHLKHRERRAEATSQSQPPIDLESIREFYPRAASVAGGEILDDNRQSLGHALQTSPKSDHIVGFSGPTNTLIAFDENDRCLGITIHSSEDTKEHVRQVRRDERFHDHFVGKTSGEITAEQIDAVSGATLTSLAIYEGIVHRLGGAKRSLRFPDPLTVADVRRLFPDAAAVKVDEPDASHYTIISEQPKEIGHVLRTSPAADSLVGYQGPSEAVIGFGAGGRVTGVALRKSYDNEPYVGYVREDDYFLSLFDDLTLNELANLDLYEAKVEGVSGATMTSMAMADGLIAAAKRRLEMQARPEPQRRDIPWTARDFGTAGVILAGLLIALTRLRASKRLRIGFQALLIGYLGLINGDMISQAMLAGWAQNGVPWRNAGGLTLLTIAALAVPLATQRNVYCTHLCPHGAAQNLLMKRLPWQIRLPKRLSRALRLIPGLLLAWCVLVATLGLSFSLVDIEPFDAWVFRVAGWATISVAVVGLAASLFVPMAYCRYGCPTGALLNFLRFNAKSDRWSRRDWTACGLLLLAAVCWMS